ncbi:enoyl-CoA hydratase/isomerase family protein [Haladaptatus pallidirubidus]|uniref:Enoyl-CoA hydratase-related protein n=2 Tax=Haladaptatus pallidirubidus TaxID=1008152 RepID=A0AAV3UIF3_9EURY|nr:enoyl-CoA hydratase/isomerase family protein [Haladaptatus pallidirubidus]
MTTMQFETLAVEISDGIATVALRNEPVNAINQDVRHELADVLEILREERVRVVVFRGAEDVFSVGADIGLFEEAQNWTTQEFRTNSRILGRVFEGLKQLEKPVIAAIDGTCVGGGLELALSCDVRIAAPDATFGFPEHNIGLIPGLGGCSRFVQFVGPGKAKDFIFTGELFDGERARELGVVERIADDPMDAADDYARDLLPQPPQALGLAKRVIDSNANQNPQTASLLESLAQSTLLQTQDHEEGIKAFREKRDPEFTGK